MPSPDHPSRLTPEERRLATGLVRLGTSLIPPISALFGRSDESRSRECFLRGLLHNLMLLAAAGCEGFNRATKTLSLGLPPPEQLPARVLSVDA